MATWYIGIDESGSFDHLNSDDKSFVCAVVTQMSHGDIMKVFKDICRGLKLCRVTDATPEHKIIKLFHGCKQGQGENRKKILNTLLEKKDKLFPRVVVCRGMPSVTVNPQQWWMSSIMGTIDELFSKKNKTNPCLFNVNDEVKFSIANRDAKCLGLLGGGRSDGGWKKYNELLKSNIEKELKRTYRRYKISVDICSAEYKAPPALADQVATMVRLAMFNDFEIVKPKNLSLGNGRDVDICIENENWLGAAEILLSNVFSGNYENVEKLENILQNADVKVWALIMRSVETTLLNRGADGNAVNHIAKIMPILLNNKKNIPDSSLLIRFFKAYCNFVGDAGRAEDNTFVEIKELLNEKTDLFISKYEKWHFYVDLLAAEAGVKFNAYDFVFPDIASLVEKQKRINMSYPSLDFLDNRADDIGSQIYGILGLQTAFQNHIDESIAYFEKDFDCATNDYYKAMVASFLVVNYHRKKDFTNAQKWLNIEDGHKYNKNDQWLVLDKLRVEALALELGGKWDGESLLENVQSWHKDGDYPWPLLLKWKAFIECKKGLDKAKTSLETSRKKLVSSQGFTIRTLALSVIAMLIVVAKEENDAAELEKRRSEYETLLKECSEQVYSFKKYISEHSEFTKAKTGDLSLWEAATLLPFNYS
ncbi:hypothetical protein [Fibrobacter sp. UWB7]|uniref:hypothetical protein n=1 Tax=Fibrobacter sp. UWB7 TaxID=1896206 RepID=UPI000922485A|nr:hypothetical protein [Fibrobacter sp. UWB7]SHM73294.1 hypothetical protein SAMN05720467_2149 [Fibrobacter sp. UWB7]